MTTMRTTSTYQLRQRALRHVEAGNEFVYVAPDGARVRIGYVMGGGSVRVEVRHPGGALAHSNTQPSTFLHTMLGDFVQLAWEECNRGGELVGGAIDARHDGYNEGVAAAAEAVQAQIDALPDVDTDLDAAIMGAKRGALRAILALLDEQEN